MRLIDGDALIESMGVSDAAKWGNKDGYQQDKSYSTLMRYEIKDYIDSQPTVDAAPVKHSGWEIVIQRAEGEYDIAGICTWATVAMCSRCAFVHHFIEGHMCYGYCPNCGAKMDLEDE